MSCNCHKPANFRAEKCKKCGDYYNGNDGMSGIRHMKICKPSKEYKDKMKAAVKKLTDNKEFMERIKKFSDSLNKK